MATPITIEQTIELKLSVRDLAGAFLQLSADEQAEFLIDVAATMATWQPKGRRYRQLAAIAGYLAGNRVGRVFVARLAELAAEGR